jgi:hypothetical protein
VQPSDATLCLVISVLIGYIAVTPPDIRLQRTVETTSLVIDA